MKVNPLSYKDTIKKARKFGFAFRRSTSGSHEIWWNEETRKTCVIPHHHEVYPSNSSLQLSLAGLYTH